MKKITSLNIRSAIVFILFLISFNNVFAQGLERSGRWLTYDNGYPYLVGYDLQQLFAQKNYTDADMDAKLNQLQEFRISAIRVWANNWFMGDNGYYPWLRGADGKFDLRSWDATYWERMKRFTQKCEDRGIIVEVAIFSEYPGYSSSTEVWWSDPTRANAWNKNRNINGFFNANSQGTFYPQFFDLNYQENGVRLRDIQQALVDKSISELNGYGNVYFQVHNEFPGMWGTGQYIGQSYPWQQHWAQYIHDKEAIAVVHAHEGSSMQLYGVEYFKDESYVDALNFHYYSSGSDNIDQISSFYHGLQRTGKILQCDESWQYEDASRANTVTREAWASFVSGAYYLHYQDTPDIIGTAAWRANAERIKVLRNVSETVKFWQMSPVDSGGNEYDYLVSSSPGSNWQVLANPGNEYVVYITTNPTATPIRVNLPSGNYRYTYYDTRTWNSSGISGATISSSGGQVTIPAPSTNSWNGETGVALVIQSETQDTTLPSTPTDLTATAISSSQIDLSWAVSTDNVGVAGYKVYRNGTQIDTTSNINYSDTGLLPSTTYTYTVSAYDAAGNNSAQSSPASATTNSASVVYLSDLSWISVTNGWGPVEKDKSNGDIAAGDGKTIILNGTTYAKGLGVHAASDVQYNLAGKYSTFMSDIGVDDEVGTNGSVIFQVFADGVKLYDSGTMTGSTPTKQVNVDITGKNTLQLVVTDAGNGINSDHADWANARITYTNTTPPSAPSGLSVD